MKHFTSYVAIICVALLHGTVAVAQELEVHSVQTAVGEPVVVERPAKAGFKIAGYQAIFQPPALDEQQFMHLDAPAQRDYIASLARSRGKNEATTIDPQQMDATERLAQFRGLMEMPVRPFALSPSKVGVFAGEVSISLGAGSRELPRYVVFDWDSTHSLTLTSHVGSYEITAFAVGKDNKSTSFPPLKVTVTMPANEMKEIVQNYLEAARWPVTDEQAETLKGVAASAEAGAFAEHAVLYLAQHSINSLMQKHQPGTHAAMVENQAEYKQAKRYASQLTESDVVFYKQAGHYNLMALEGALSSYEQLIARAEEIQNLFPRSHVAALAKAYADHARELVKMAK